MKLNINTLNDSVTLLRRRLAGYPNFQKLDAAYRAEDYRRAVFLAQDTVDQYPESNEAKYKLALALSRDNQVLRAKSCLEPVLAAVSVENTEHKKYQRAFDVIVGKIQDSERWVEEQIALNNIGPLSKEVQGESNWPNWIKLRKLHSDPAITGTDYLRQKAELLYGMHAWQQASEAYFDLLQSGKSIERDLKKYAKCLIRNRRYARIVDVLAEINNIRLRSNKKALTIEDLATDVREPIYAVETVTASTVNGVEDASRLDQLQIRLREAGRVNEAIHVGMVLEVVAPSAKREFRTGLHAEQMGQLRLAKSQYIKSASRSAGHASLGSLRAARLIAACSTEQDVYNSLLVCYEHWSKFDVDNELVNMLAALIDSSSASPVPSSSVEHENGKPDAERGVQALPQLVDDVKTRLLDELDSVGDIPYGAIASRSLRRHEAMRLLQSGDKQAAVNEAIKQTFSQTEYSPSDFIFLTYVLARSERFSDAVQVLIPSERNADPFCYQAPRANMRTQQVFRYLTLRDQLPIASNVFLWESHFGNRVDCNPYAMWRDLVSRPDRPNDIHVWVCNDHDVVPADVIQHPQVVLTRRESAGYWLALATAKFLINNASFSFEFMRRPGQVYANTWHGTPLKALGRDDHDSPYDFGNVSRNFLHATDLIMPNDFTSKIMRERYCIAPLFEGRHHVVGQARNDRLITMSDSEQRELRMKLGLGESEAFVLYAPTWRGGSKSAWFDVAHLESDIASLNSSGEFVLGFRGHPLALESLKSLNPRTLVPDSSISTYDLIAIADVLITDYSSLGVDYLCLKRPVIYYVHDYDEYVSTRGLNISLDDFPGHVVRSRDELTPAVERALSGNLISESEMETYRESYASFDDGNAATRAVDILLEGPPSKEVGSGQNQFGRPILMAHGLRNRDSLEAFIETANAIADSGEVVVVAFDHSAVVADPGLVQVLYKLSDSIQVLPRKGMFIRNSNEYHVTESYYDSGFFAQIEGSEAFSEAVEREAYRLFGDICFSLAVCWGFDNSLQTALCSLGVEADYRIGYTDIDLDGLWTEFHPEEQRVLRLLHGFDQLISADKKTGEWLTQRSTSDAVRIVERQAGGQSENRRFAVDESRERIVIVGADTDIDNLCTVIESVEQLSRSNCGTLREVVMYVQGPARIAVADILTSVAKPVSIEVRTDDYPYGRLQNASVLIDCTTGAVPSMASLDAVSAETPIIRFSRISEHDGERENIRNQLAAQVESALSDRNVHSVLPRRSTSVAALLMDILTKSRSEV